MRDGRHGAARLPTYKVARNFAPALRQPLVRSPTPGARYWNSPHRIGCRCRGCFRQRAPRSSTAPTPRSCPKAPRTPSSSRRCGERRSTTSRPKRSRGGRRTRGCGAATCSRRRRPRRWEPPSQGRWRSTAACSSSAGRRTNARFAWLTASCFVSCRATRTRRCSSSFSDPRRPTPPSEPGRARWDGRPRAPRWPAPGCMPRIPGCGARPTASRATSPSTCGASSYTSRSRRRTGRPSWSRRRIHPPRSRSRCWRSCRPCSASEPASSSGWASTSPPPRHGGRSASWPGRSS